jgi:hypothetical protein
MPLDRRLLNRPSRSLTRMAVESLTLMISRVFTTQADILTLNQARRLKMRSLENSLRHSRLTTQLMEVE